MAVPAIAQPTGGNVVVGQATIGAPSAGTTVINQSSQKAIINWQDFSVAAGQTVQFAQPNAASVTLNRVTGGGASDIRGAVRANGQVWLINPNGVLFGQGATVNVGGLLATTADIADNDFLSGNYAFSTGGGNGGITNNGSIRTAAGGSVVLSARRVANTGLIQAQGGHVVLGGADAFTVDFNGDHLLSYAVTAPAGQSAQVSNSGTISAGRILMTARAAANVADSVVNNSGIVEATSAHMENGDIVLDAGGGTAVAGGTLDASGKGAGQTGGSVQVLGQTVQVAAGANIDVSGDAGGGQVLIGGNFHGAGPQPNAQTTTVGNATIDADAIHSGNGGKVAVWSDDHTEFAGTITARGGATGGNGGQVETSGHVLAVDSTAMVNTAAPLGTPGDWLLDPVSFLTPQNIVVANGGTDPATGEVFGPSTSTSTIDPTTIVTALGSGNVTMQADTDITLQSAINVTVTTANTLTLQAGRSIVLGAGITYNTGSLVLSANDPGADAASRLAGPASITGTSSTFIQAASVDLILHSDGSDGGSIGSLATPLNVGVSHLYINTNGANAYVSTGIANTALSLGNSGHALAIDMGAGNAFLTTAGLIQSAPISLHDLSIVLPSGTTSSGPILLTNPANAITGTFSADALGGSPYIGYDFINVLNSTGLTVGVINDMPGSDGDRGSMTLNAQGGGLTLTGDIDIGLITLDARGDITQTGGRIYSHHNAGNNFPGGMAINATNGGSISLPGDNVIEQTVDATGNGSETAVTNMGQIAFGADGDATINLASSVAVYAAYTGGALSITTTGSYILDDVAGNPSTHYSEIDINNPVTAPGMITLHAAGDIKQILNTGGDVSISSTAGGLTATSDNGSIDLVDGGDGGTDLGNRVHGYVVFNSAGDTNFVNTVDTILGGPAYYPIDPNTGQPIVPTYPYVGTPMAPPTNYVSPDSYIGGNLDVEVTDANEFNADPSVLVLAGRIHAENNFGGYSTLHSVGDMINNNGAGTIIVGNSDGQNNNLSLVSDQRTIGASDGTSWTFGLGAEQGTLNLHASAGGSIVINPGDINIGVEGLSGGLTANYILVFGNGIVTQNEDDTGIITGGPLDIHAAGDIVLDNPANAVNSQIDFRTPGSITFYNSIDTFIEHATSGQFDSNGIPIPAQDVTIVVHDPSGDTSPSLTIGSVDDTDQNNVAHHVSIEASDFVNLQADGNITDGYDANDPGTFASAGHITVQDGGLTVSSLNGSISLTNPANSFGYVTAGTDDQDIAITAQSPTGTLDAEFEDAGIDAGEGNVTLMAIGADLVGDTITANNLNVAGNSVVIGDAEVNSLSAKSSGGQIIISSPNGFDIDNLTGGPGIDSGGGTVILEGDFITQSDGDAGKIFAGDLEAVADGDGGLQLTNPANEVTGTLTLISQSDAAFFNAVDTHLGSSEAVGSLTVHSAGDLEIVSEAVVLSNAGSGDGVVLAADGNFINNSGPGAIILTGETARFLIYSQSPANDVFGGLDSQNTAVWNVSFPDSVGARGNRYVFAEQPVLTFTSTDVTKSFGTDATDTVATAYTVSGFSQGVENAFLGDNPETIFSGAPSVTSAGSAVNASASGSPYAITVASGTLEVGNGYGVAFESSGLLTVNASATLVYVADPANRFYGSANPVFSGTVTGFMGDDTLANSTSGTLVFTSTATATSGVGNYAIIGSGLTSQNYAFAQDPGNSTALTINPATLTFVANAASRAYGAANPAFSGGVTGFLNGDTLASSTIGTLAFSSPASAGTLPGNYAINGSGLSAANYIFVQAASNATALTVTQAVLSYTANLATKVYGTANPVFGGTVTGFVNGDTQQTATTGTLAFASTAQTTSDAGSYVITGSGLSAQNYVFTQAAGNSAAFLINPASLTTALIGSVSKTYDGTTAAAVSADNFAPLSGIVGSDTVSLVFPATGSFDSASVGSEKTVTVTGLSLAGAQAHDYSIASSVSAAIGEITQGTGPTAPEPPVLISVVAASQAASSSAFTQNTFIATIEESSGGGAGGAPPPPPSTVVTNTPTVATLTPPPTNPLESLTLSDNGFSNQSTTPEPPTSSDIATNFIIASMDGGLVPGGGDSDGDDVIIPGLLRAVSGRTQTGSGSGDDLSAWGNPALWQ